MLENYSNIKIWRNSYKKKGMWWSSFARLLHMFKVAINLFPMLPAYQRMPQDYFPYYNNVIQTHFPCKSLSYSPCTSQEHHKPFFFHEKQTPQCCHLLTYPPFSLPCAWSFHLLQTSPTPSIFPHPLL